MTKSTRLLRLLPLAVTASLLFSSCSSLFESYDAQAARRREKLLEMYPPKTTTRADVQNRFGGKPTNTFQRPAKGWETDTNRMAAYYGQTAEKRIGKRIPLAERYFGADGLFSLCHCWFYYDSHDRLLDAEWVWSSD